MNIEIPGELITKDSHIINYSNLKGKTLIGLCGYARASKDCAGEMLVSRLGFKRISFGDLLKNDLNIYMKNEVFDDLQSKGIDLNYEKIDFINPESIEIKEILRPYMIWFGEEMKKVNGVHHWTNRAFSQISAEDTKIVITDVRRSNELDVFRNNREFISRREHNKSDLGYGSNFTGDVYEGDFETLLVHVSKLGNKDMDSLTIEALRIAHEDWLFDYTILVDSRIPNENDNYNKHMLGHIRTMALKFPEYFI